VHKGFYVAWESIIPHVLRALDSASPAPTHLFITGHSLVCCRKPVHRPLALLGTAVLLSSWRSRDALPGNRGLRWRR
jgi:hypothetical protein